MADYYEQRPFMICMYRDRNAELNRGEVFDLLCGSGMRHLHKNDAPTIVEARKIAEEMVIKCKWPIEIWERRYSAEDGFYKYMYTETISSPEMDTD